MTVDAGIATIAEADELAVELAGLEVLITPLSQRELLQS